MSIKSWVIVILVLGGLAAGGFYVWNWNEGSKLQKARNAAYELRNKEKAVQNAEVERLKAEEKAKQEEEKRKAQEKLEEEKRKQEQELRNREQERKNLTEREKVKQNQIKLRDRLIVLKDSPIFEMDRRIRLSRPGEGAASTGIVAGTSSVAEPKTGVVILPLEALREMEQGIVPNLPTGLDKQNLQQDLLEGIVAGAAMLGENAYMNEVLTKIPDSNVFSLTLTELCTVCNGQLKVLCKTCLGNGHCPGKCYNGKSKKPINLRDYVLETCSRCNGSNKCSDCNGVGTVPCTNCHNGRTLVQAKCLPVYNNQLDRVINGLNKIIGD